MLAALAAAVIASGQVRTMGLPKVTYELPIVGGQREILLGPKPYDFTLLNGYLEKEYGPQHMTTPSDTGGGYVDSMIPGGWQEANLGYFDFSTKPATLFDKPCILITTTAKWNQKMGKKPNEIKWQNLAKQQWWVSQDGTILRNFAQLQTPDGTQSGDCAYGKDSIQRRYTDVRGQSSFGEIFPSCGMEGLNAQFKPMVVDGKLVLREKEFWIANPITGGLDKYTVRSAGTFKGEILNATFKGMLFDIEGPNKTSQKVYLDEKGDLVRVNLDLDRFFVIGNVPKSHLDEFNRPIRKSGG